MYLICLFIYLFIILHILFINNLIAYILPCWLFCMLCFRGRAVANVGRTCSPTPLFVLIMDRGNKICLYHTTWDEHIQNIYNKAAYSLNIMRMLKFDLDRKSLLRFYISFIRPMLEYGNILWDNCTKQQSDLLESMQLDAARIITGLRRGTSHQGLLSETGIPALSARRTDAKLIQFYKILNNEAPSYIDEIVKKN